MGAVWERHAMCESALTVGYIPEPLPFISQTLLRKANLNIFMQSFNTNYFWTFLK